jgi:hypothetical protein
MAIATPESPTWRDRLTQAICDGENVEARAVQRNQGTSGVDGMTVEQLPGVLARH